MMIYRVILILALAVMTITAGCVDGNRAPAGATRPQLTDAKVQAEEAEDDGSGQAQSALRYDITLAARAAEPVPWMDGPATDRENYASLAPNPIHLVTEDPVSTFSIDVDTASYSNTRRMLNSGRLPPPDAVRIEEFINYFDYAYPAPDSAETPFALHTEIGPNPWNPQTHLLHIGIQGLEAETREDANLVFLVDVSGSMQSPDKLDLLKNALRLLTHQLDADDRVSLVVYAGASGVVLEPTPGDQRATIENALARLSAGGSTNGGAGIELAYAKAREGFIDGGINRVILATDGDFNVGTADFEALLSLIERQRKSGIALTTLGFGRGNLNDHLLEQLADNGNGNYFYIDTLAEAQKVLVDELFATLMTIARDVKIQVEFNPSVVTEYRLVGYENRILAREDFNNDKVDAGDIGAGHSVTAIYELALAGSGGARVDPLRYQHEATSTSDSINRSNELGFLKLRYKLPEQTSSRLLERALLRDEIIADLAATSARYRFSAAVAAFAQQLRGGEYLASMEPEAIESLARHSRGDDPWGHRGELLTMMRIADSLGSALARE